MGEINQHHSSGRNTAHRSSPSSGGTSSSEAFTRSRHLLAGLGWNTIGQFLVLGLNLVVTPFLLHRLGATPYGIFALVSSTRGLISNLDGGLAPAGYRYLPVYVGRGNVTITTSFLLTIITLVGIVVGAEAITVTLFAPDIATVFAHGSDLAIYSHEMAQLLRIMMPVLFVSAILTPLQRLLMAHHRWAFINYTQLISVVVYIATTVVVSFETSGLQCLVWGTYAQQAIVTITVLWACRRYISVKGLRWLPISEVRQILRFGARVQIAAVASSFNFEVDSLLVGFLFPVSYVAYYNIGVNFSQQVMNLPTNGLNPIMQDIGIAFGKSGRGAVLRSFRDTQRKWVTALGIFPLVAALEGWFGVSIWLGHGSQIAAATAAILIIGSTPLSFNSIVDVTTKVVGMPEIESWYLGIGVALNVACAIPIALRVGVIGVPIGTAIGQVISFFVCIYLARKKLGKEITSFFPYIRYLPASVAIAVAVVCEWIFRDSMPTGGIGLILTGLLTLPAFLVYYGWTYRSLLLQRFGNRVLAAEDGRQGRPGENSRGREIEEDDSAYAGSQLRGVQALMALAESPYVSSQYTSRQLRGMQALMALAEPEMERVVPFSGTSVRLRYTGPLGRVYGRPLEPPSRTELSDRE